MSTASKITFGTSCLFAVSAFAFINFNQKLERDALRQGPIKDAARVEAKRQEMSSKQRSNDLEHKQQMELKERFEKLQPLSGEIIVADEDTKS